jgi:membrane-associated phospholipid phosphatase
MEYLTQFFLPVSIWFQTAPDWLISIMKGFTFLGDTEFYLLAMPLLYWCIDLALGIRIGVLLLLSGGLNTIFKFGFSSPRPFCVSGKVVPLVDATGFGFPSGHAQNAAGIWGLFSAQAKKGWLKVISISLIIIIGLSRIILGVHFAHDVLAGWLIGLILLFTFIKFEDRVINWFKNSSVGRQILTLTIFTGLFIIIPRLMVNPLDPGAFQTNILCAFNPYDFEGLMTSFGAFYGLGIGIILLYQTGWYKVEGSVWKRILRYLVGMIVVLALYLGLKAIFPDDLSVLAYGLRFVRYFLIGIWISFGAPKFFEWIKLA